jgi:3-deoxy-D-arabino-heptulosonate 7-phosphate (DAHP) synthase
LLQLLSERDRMTSEIVQENKRQGISEEEPIGDQQILNELANHNLAIPKGRKDAVTGRNLLVSRHHKSEDTIIHVKDAEIGGSSHVIVAGPCSIESRDQLLTVAAAMKKAGVAALAAGADGIMVEVHSNPQVALSDANQQINIDEFNTFWKGLRDSGLYH